MVFRFLILVCATFLITGCGEKVQRKPNTLLFAFDETFAQKPADEVVRFKYQKALVTCRLWSQNSNKLNLATEPAATATIDLLAPRPLPMMVTLNGTLPQHDVRVSLNFLHIKIAPAVELIHPETGKPYLAQYSPMVHLELTYAAVSKINKITTETNGSTLRTLLENSPDMSLNLSQNPSTTDGVPPFKDYVDCYLATELKPEIKSALGTK